MPILQNDGKQRSTRLFISEIELTQAFIFQDTMMECSGTDGGGLEDLVNLASDIADSAPSIRAAAERLLTLLGVDEDDEASSSEDEGVEVDLEDSDGEDPQDTRLLHQLAASLAQELKYAKQNSSNSKLALQSQGACSEVQGKDGTTSSMDFGPETTREYNSTSFERRGSSAPFCHSEESRLSRHLQHRLHEQLPPPPPYQCTRVNALPQPHEARGKFEFVARAQNHAEMPPAYPPFGSCAMIEDPEGPRLTNPVSWGVGWEACASEALRYLVEDEGLPPHHPTVVAMKNHLDLQRGRVLSHRCKSGSTTRRYRDRAGVEI
ncbi:uncharacterized protein LOC124416102 isoform X2 [Diprion similis]|uniref:uncharacterized protein LOC124416102 isoform X2 n=1 Tax=Diprion similis TaxID=362088 RepID=UPI001EF99CCF|nr:uncharacterized protein LOC124416102 isoform X2 [Diprion similis]